MEQPQGALTPHASARHFLGAELRRWRRRRELSVAELARSIYVSRELLQKVETAQRRATADLIRACDTELDTDGALGRLLDFITHAEQAVPPAPPPTSPPAQVIVKITAEVVPVRAPSTRSASDVHGDGLAKVYRLTDRRRHAAMTIDPAGPSTGAVHLMAAPERLQGPNPGAAGDD